ncbi:MAG: HD domain-containing protein [Mariprofundaceae bacterium]|nr:HD domain-containing protein [Mariprofundaceae bacterium]
MLEVLVLEDQPAVREVIAEIIGDLNVPVHVGQAGSLSEARVLLDSQHWDGLVTDLSLGDGISLDLIAELQSKQMTMPIILVSGFLSQDRLKEAERLNIKHILSKPFDSEVLLACMQSALLPNADIAVVKKPGEHKNDRLLPELFEMDRRLGLIYRMFDEMPRHQDVSGVCKAALGLAMEMVHAQGGFLALFQRERKKMIMVSKHFSKHEDIVSNVDLSATPFQEMMNANTEYLEVMPGDAASKSCWPNVNVEQYVAIPVSLQGVHMGVLCLTDRESIEPLKSEERHMLGLLAKKLDTLLDNRAVHAALADSMNETLIALVRSLEARDRYTKDHSARVGELSRLFAEELGLDDKTIQIIRTGGLLHDIGKVGITDAVLLKPGRYTDQEFAIMKAHPAIGDSILKNMDTLHRERLMVRHHHERFDGRGYPDSLGGEDIPFEARIVCVADAIDAMTTNRVYRMARPLTFCMEQLKESSGTQFDSQVVDVALSVIERGLVKTQAKSVLTVQDILMPLSATHLSSSGALHV